MPDAGKMHQEFLASRRKHVLMITNHGIHQWRIIPGLPDTGGQNVFVNQFTAALVELGFKITIVNRGGYPHPVTGECRRGLHYKGKHRRILYLEDEVSNFIRKEDMHERLPNLAESLKCFLDAERGEVGLIISHYWDGAKLGALYNQSLRERVKHVWVPHSLGAIKKRNVAKEKWAGLRIDERIAAEQELIPEMDGIAATSAAIGRALAEDYECTKPPLFLPPCVDTERYYPRKVSNRHDVWGFLGERAELSPEEVRRRKIVTEISRTDTTKRKSVLLKAFAQARKRTPDSLLIISIDGREKELSGMLKGLIRTFGLQNHVAVVGYVWDLLPTIYAITDIYCTPSVMEGFGMSAQEAAASGVPVVASRLVPFATEYLAPAKGAIVVPADDVDGFAHSLETLLTDDDLRKEMGERAYHATIPRFTWRDRVTAFLDEIEFKR